METSNTGYVDYGAGAAGPHMRYHGLDEEEGPKEVRIHLMFCFLKTVPVSVQFGSLILLFLAMKATPRTYLMSSTAPSSE